MKKNGTKMMMLGLLTTALLLHLFAGCNNGSGLHTTTYTVTYDGNGATGGSAPTDSTTYTEGSTVTVLGNPGTLEKTSYTFAGWNAASDGSGETYVAGSTFTMGTADVTLYAVWSQNTHTLSFDANGGSGSMDSVTVAEGATVTLSANTFARTHYVFAGWATAAEGSVVYSDGGSYTMGATDVILYAVWSPSMSAQWAKVVTGGGGYSSSQSVGVDGDGNIYAAGYQNGTGSFTYGTGVSTAGTYGEGSNAVVVKYDGSGVAQWAQVATGGGAASYFNGDTVDGDGNVYAAGYQYGTGTFTYGTNVSATGDGSSNNSVVVMYNSSGAAQWAQVVTVAGTGGASSFHSVTVDGDGNVYAAGDQCGTGTFTYGTNVSATGDYGDYNSVVVMYNSSGAAQWAQVVTGGGGASYFNGVTVDSDGNVYAAGYQYGTGTFSYGTGVSATGDSSRNNSVVVKYNSSGVAQWAQVVTGGGYASSFHGITVDEDGNVYAAGYQCGKGTYTYGTNVSATGDFLSNNSVVVKYNSSGVAQWAQVVTGGGDLSSFSSVTADADANVYAVGYQYGTGTFTYGTNVSATGDSSSNNSVVVKYNSSGVAQCANVVTGGGGPSSFNSVTVDEDENVYLGGYQYGTGTFTYSTGVSATGDYNKYNSVAVKYQ
jgi:uncharacterized repeat protein (TIGR02543 family)